MKKTTLLTIALAAALTACNNDNPAPAQDGTEASFTARIAGTTGARAYDNTWEAGDAIGISATSGDKTYTNLQYTTDGTGAFTATADKIYFQTDADVTFTAYYPWTSLNGATATTADTRLQAKQKSFDYLYAQAVGSKASPNVALAFAHKMSKLVFTVRCGNDVTLDELKKVALSLDGFKTTAAFDVATGTAAAEGTAEPVTFANAASADNNAPLAVDETAGTITFTMITAPQDFTAPLSFVATLPGAQTFKADIDFTTANRNAGDAAARNEWKPGYQYNISVTVTKTSVNIEGCTIAGWIEADGGDVVAK